MAGRRGGGGWCVTCQLGVFRAPRLRQTHQLPQQQRVPQDPLDRFDQVGLQRRRVLIGWVPGLQEVFEGRVRPCWKSSRTFSVSFPVAPAGVRGQRSGVVTSLQDLLHLDVADAEAAVVLEVVGVVQEGASQRAEQRLAAERRVSLVVGGVSGVGGVKGAGAEPSDTCSCPGVSRLPRSGQEATRSTSVWRKTFWKSSISGRLPNSASIWWRRERHGHTDACRWRYDRMVDCGHHLV